MRYECQNCQRPFDTNEPKPDCPLCGLPLIEVPAALDPDEPLDPDDWRTIIRLLT